ncbi:RNA polymerase sigma factor SigX [Heyndrickxia vini]|uniref:RNA polymerase sigma factor n=1 Tax=Heyndrickxia vini TaxID=1476025 RepID=A0ABX7E4L4_9BACI|nr:RNA polymerase sigma factor SigX [Heyndrickxia vini]QQZ10219.1 RNA polymerase sigma factor SigX [Heyndrickxia vini]
MEKQFYEIYEKYHQNLFQFLFYMVKSREQAEDLIQEVYIRILKSYHQFENRSSEKTWIFSIAKHVAIDFFRKQKRWKHQLSDSFDGETNLISDHSPLPEDIALQNESIQIMYRCLDKCKLDQRLVLILRYIQSLSIQETASVLGWSEGKVKTTQHRALKTIRSLMQSEIEKGEENCGKIRLER